MYRLAERFGKQHVGDFLAGMENGAELTGLFAYLHQDDEMQVMRTAYAIVKALGGDKKNTSKARDLDEDEEVIDTTAAGFAQNFKGFINAPQAPRPVHTRQASTEILMG